eukprot:TRINITY_DN15229_c0_g1_i1.p1 TRINITY_DN15229_c0_g1~~TRINITY_DN15229_c0_g1_i1.p1  ORF type:complete len:183 (-),score=40.22 TRINITY_DN15229_c0_g1_i1:103-651(-)
MPAPPGMVTGYDPVQRNAHWRSRCEKETSTVLHGLQSHAGNGLSSMGMRMISESNRLSPRMDGHGQSFFTLGDVPALTVRSREAAGSQGQASQVGASAASGSVGSRSRSQQSSSVTGSLRSKGSNLSARSAGSAAISGELGVVAGIHLSAELEAEQLRRRRAEAELERLQRLLKEVRQESGG